MRELKVLIWIEQAQCAFIMLLALPVDALLVAAFWELGRQGYLKEAAFALLVIIVWSIAFACASQRLRSLRKAERERSAT